MHKDFITLLEQPFKNFKENIFRINQLTQIGSDVGRFTVELLENLMSQYEKMPAFLEFKTKFKRDIEIIKGIKDHPDFKSKYAAIYQQALTLVVSSFESFLNEISICVFNEYPFMVKWPDKRLSLDLSVFEYSKQTVGDIVLRSVKEKYSFQDLQSTINFFNDYFNTKISLKEELKDRIILYQAIRHTLIHHNGKVDEKFLKQTRELNFDFSNGDNLIIQESDYFNVRESFFVLAEVISKEINKNKIPF